MLSKLFRGSWSRYYLMTTGYLGSAFARFSQRDEYVIQIRMPNDRLLLYGESHGVTADKAR